MALTERDYEKLTRQQRVALFLIIIGPDAAAEVLRQFEDVEIELICREMSTFSVVPSEVQRLLCDEFSPILMRSASSAIGGIGYAQKTLEIAKGNSKASAIVGRIEPGRGNSMDFVKGISEMEGRQIFNLIKSEHPQTIAFLLSYLDSGKSAAVFGLLDPEVRDEVIERLGTIESTSIELVEKIVRNLGKHFDNKSRTVFHHSGGVRAVADLMNRLDKEMSKNLLTRLEDRNPALTAAVRKKIFGFEDLLRLQPADMQRVLREVDSSNLAVAMKSASGTLRDRIYASISKRAAEGLKEEVEMLGPVRLKDVDAVQEAIIKEVRRLEEAGEISLDSEGAQGVVS